MLRWPSLCGKHSETTEKKIYINSNKFDFFSFDSSTDRLSAFFSLFLSFSSVQNAWSSLGVCVCVKAKPRASYHQIQRYTYFDCMKINDARNMFLCFILNVVFCENIFTVCQIYLRLSIHFARDRQNTRVKSGYEGEEGEIYMKKSIWNVFIAATNTIHHESYATKQRIAHKKMLPGK